MGLRAMYIIEVKTRLIEIGQEMDDLRKTLSRVDSHAKETFSTQMKALEEQFTQLQSDHDLMRMFDESEWGKFPDTMDKAIHKLRHDVGALRAALETPFVTA